MNAEEIGSTGAMVLSMGIPINFYSRLLAAPEDNERISRKAAQKCQQTFSRSPGKPDAPTTTPTGCEL